MIYTNVEHAAEPLAAILAGKRHVLVITHVNPDGDAVGALVGLGLALEQRGHTVTLLAPSSLPPFVRNMPQVERIQVYTEDATLPPETDLVVLVDTGDAARIARVWEEQQVFLLARPLIVIDHHVTNSGQGVCNLVDPTISSTCELIYHLMRAWDTPISPDIATALLLGVTTDTQSFRTSNTTPSALRAAADLLESGGDIMRIVHDVYLNTPYTHARLLALALDKIQQRGSIVWTGVTLAMFDSTGAHEDAASEVTDYLSSLGGFKASAIFRERRDGSVKVSLRSRPGVDVSLIASQFGGGGHRQAAGCTVPGSLAEVEQLVIEALEQVVAGAA